MSPRVRRHARSFECLCSFVGLVMSLLRMIKLFGWEGKISERLREKREDELVWIKQGRIWSLVNMNLKLVFLI